MYGLIAIPVVAAGAGIAYYSGIFSKTPSAPPRPMSFSGDYDSDDPGSLYEGNYQGSGRRRKTSKGKSKNKKTKRRR